MPVNSLKTGRLKITLSKYHHDSALGIIRKLAIVFMDEFILKSNGGVTSPGGFSAVAEKAGIKTSGELDMAILASDKPAIAAGAFTDNEFAASSVCYGREILKNPKAQVRAVFVNSGCANACTGRRGGEDTRKIAGQVARAVGCEAEEVLVCSTGRIGTFLPMTPIGETIRGIAHKLSESRENGGLEAARAIMTTDTRPKSVAVTLNVDGQQITVGGMCKGAGMIAPQLKPAFPHATMLAFITTDARVERNFLNNCLADSLSDSFNRITVDGDSSTNDSVIALANGCAGNEVLDAAHPGAEAFKKAFCYLSRFLAREIVKDGEGATRFVEVMVKEAASMREAKECAHAVADSMLCKTAWFGGDPNWGRILAAAGGAGVSVVPEKTKLEFNGVPAVVSGVAADSSEKELRKAMDQEEISVELKLGSGDAEYTAWTCDLSYKYVEINAEYHT